ncbi:MAG: Nif3-like dinuclear metal center hexameric protein [Metamycoplasmataceae bacterium]
MKINNQNELVKLLEKEFPLNHQEPWDFGGFSFIAKKQRDLKVLICLDADKETILRAIREEVSFIISHHPFCFAPTKREAIKIDSTKKELFDLLKKHNISVYSIHTSFDINPKGTHHYLLKRLGLLNNNPIQINFSTVVNYSSSFKSLVELLKEKLALDFVLSNWDKPESTIIKKVYFAPGAGDVYEFIKYNQDNSCDLLVTSDIKWNEQVVLQNAKINFIIISHKIEEVFIDGIHEFIKEKINENIEIVLDYKKNNLKKF